MAMRSAYALVIGIDDYVLPDIPKLSGAVADALAAVKWLRAIEVPAANIFLHLGAAAAPQAIDSVNPLGARWDDIWASMDALSRAQADQLFVFMSGHGFAITGTGPIFLSADYGEANNTNRNFNINQFLRLFQSWKFKDQFLFYDACQTMIASIGQISPVTPTGPPGGVDALIIPDDNALTACFAAREGQAASEDGYRGFMMSALLSQLDLAAIENWPPTARQQGAITYDWGSGARTLDLKKLFEDVVQPEVARRAQKVRKTQDALCRVFGRAEREGVSPIFTLPQLPVMKLNLDMSRREAAPHIEDLRLSLRDPVRQTWFPDIRGEQVALPFAFAAPRDNNVAFVCTLAPSAPYRIVNTGYDQRVETITTGNVMIEVDRFGSPARPELQEFNVRILDAGGAPAHSSIHGRYESISKKHNLPLDALPAGVTFHQNEHGPHITFTPAARDAAGQVAAQWRDGLDREVREQGQVVVLSPPGETPEQSAPTLRIVLSEADAKALAGFLTTGEIVTIQAEDPRTPALITSLDALLSDPLLRVEPGKARIVIDLPWHRYEDTITIERGRIVDWRLPEPQGARPLRNLVSYPILGVQHLVLPDEAAGAPYHFIAPDDATPYALPVLGGLALLARYENDVWRFEPFSTTTLREWDMLIACGRLDGVSAERLSALAKTAGDAFKVEAEFGVLLLAMAYSAFDQHDMELVRQILTRMPKALQTCPDTLLLGYLATLSDAKVSVGDRAALTDVLDGVANARLAPLMRWGVPLLQQMFVRFDREVPRWLQGFAASSVWNVLHAKHAPDRW